MNTQKTKDIKSQKITSFYKSHRKIIWQNIITSALAAIVIWGLFIIALIKYP